MGSHLSYFIVPPLPLIGFVNFSKSFKISGIPFPHLYNERTGLESRIY